MLKYHEEIQPVYIKRPTQNNMAEQKLQFSSAMSVQVANGITTPAMADTRSADVITSEPVFLLGTSTYYRAFIPLCHIFHAGLCRIHQDVDRLFPVSS
jgi:hypothetical protein